LQINATAKDAEEFATFAQKNEIVFAYFANSFARFAVKGFVL
jgi:hypothetical protein